MNPKLSEIEPVAYFIDYTHQEKPVFLQKEIVHDLRNKSEDGGIVKSLHTAEQMQEYAKAKVLEALGKYGVRDDEWSDHEVNLAHKQMTKFIFEEEAKND